MSFADIETIVDRYVKRTSGATRPWSDTERDGAINDIIDQFWPVLGVYTYGEVATDQTTQYIAVPTAFTGDPVTYKISSIFIKNSQGIVSDKATGFRVHPVSNQLFLKTQIASGNTFALYGWTPFHNGNTSPWNLLARMNSLVATGAAAILWRGLAAELANSELQQTIDNGRIVTMQAALAQAAAFQTTFDGLMDTEPTRITTAPRASVRGR